MKHNYKLSAVIRFAANKAVPGSDIATIENGATDKLKIELESYLKGLGIEIVITSDFGDLEENG